MAARNDLAWLRGAALRCQGLVQMAITVAAGLAAGMAASRLLPRRPATGERLDATT